MEATDNNNHLFYMNLALDQAELALSEEEVPVGAIIVNTQGLVIGCGFNRTETIGCQTGHAEILAIEEACKARGDWRLDDCIIYVTLEPCLMCFGLIMLSRIKAVYYGASSPLFGCGIDNRETFPLYRGNLIVQGGISSEKSTKLLREFFQYRRKNREECMENRDAFLKKMKESLLAKKLELTDSLKRIDRQDKTGDRQIMDSADEASALNMEKLQSSIEMTEISEVKLVDDALVRIAKGEYGVCITCAKPISDKRLEYYPYAARCISCQESHEG